MKIFVQADGQSVEAYIACKCKDQHQVIPQKVSVSFVCTIEGISEHLKTIKSFVAFFTPDMMQTASWEEVFKSGRASRRLEWLAQLLPPTRRSSR